MRHSLTLEFLSLIKAAPPKTETATKAADVTGVSKNTNPPCALIQPADSMNGKVNKFVVSGNKAAEQTRVIGFSNVSRNETIHLRRNAFLNHTSVSQVRQSGRFPETRRENYERNGNTV